MSTLLSWLFVILSCIDRLSYCFEQLCSLQPVKPDATDCRARIPTFYFDATSASCKCFYYKGCGATENHFKSLSECMITCSVRPDKQVDRYPCETLKKNSAALPTNPPTPSSGGVGSFKPKPKPEAAKPTSHTCDQPIAQGDCLDYIPSFYYNKKLGMCDCFIYSGCQGNPNRFKSMQQCMSKCGVEAQDQAVTDNCKRDFEGTDILLQLLNDKTLKGNLRVNALPSCEQDPKEGTCRAYIPSFYFNKHSGKCDCFIYTGCQGNENRYKNLYDCVNGCGISLKDQDVPSKCREYFNGTQILAQLLKDSRLRGNNEAASHRDSAEPPKGELLFFPALPAFSQPFRDIPKKIIGTLFSGSSSRPKSMNVGDPVGSSFFENAQHSWQKKDNLN